MLGKTIQIYLPDGDARSIKEAEVRESSIRAVFIPRSKLKEAQNLSELDRAGLYFLFGDEDELGRPKTYIGESENLAERITNHSVNKEFWKIAVLFMSEKSHLNKAHFRYLENYSYVQAKSIQRCVLENGLVPTKSAVSRADENTALHFYEDVKLLLSALGYPVLEAPERQADKLLYYFKTTSRAGKSADASGFYSVDGFTVLKGSVAIAETTASGVLSKRLQEQLVQSGVLTPKDDHFVFAQDYTFKSPSSAGDVVAGRSTNGWTGWKTKDGKTLDQVERQTLKSI